MRWAAFWVWSVLPLAAQQGRAVGNGSRSPDESQSAATRQQQSEACMKSAQRSYWDAVAEELRAIADMQVLMAEKKKALEELRQGLYCSKCMRTASEIEKQEKVSFQQHLQDKKGVSVPAPASVVRDKAADFDRKIQNVADVQAQVQELEKRAQTDYARCSAELANVAALQQQMPVVTEVLKAQEQVRLEQQRAETIQRKLQTELEQLQKWYGIRREQLSAEMMPRIAIASRQKQSEAELPKYEQKADQEAMRECSQANTVLGLPDIDYLATAESLMDGLETIQA